MAVTGGIRPGKRAVMAPRSEVKGNWSICRSTPKAYSIIVVAPMQVTRALKTRPPYRCARRGGSGSSNHKDAPKKTSPRAVFTSMVAEPRSADRRSPTRKIQPHSTTPPIRMEAIQDALPYCRKWANRRHLGSSMEVPDISKGPEVNNRENERTPSQSNGEWKGTF